MSPGNHVLDRCLDPLREEQFGGGKGRSIVKYRDFAVSCAKTAEPIEMLFGMWTRLGPRKHVLDVGCTLAQPGEYN